MKRQNKTILRFQIALFFLIFFISCACAQSLPPAKADGFVYGSHLLDSDAILIDAFFDPVCPDSRDAWPPLKQVLQNYGQRVQLVVHLLPLPYHDNGFAASRAIHIVNNLNTSATFLMLEKFFKYQEKFYNAQTLNLSRAAVVTELVKFTTELVGNSHYNDIASGFKDRNTDLKTRISFKYSCSRGVYGTPTFFVNGFVLPDAGSALDFKGWKTIIDPLIRGQGPKNLENLHYFS